MIGFFPLKQSTASQEVLLGPFLDDTDGKTAETALTIANTDIKIWKSGGTSEANKNSGGATHIAAGRYYAVLDATDTDTLGPLEINVHVSGALPVKLRCMVMGGNAYDSLVLGTDVLWADAIQLGGTSQTARDIGASVLLSPGTGTGQISLSSGAVTVGAMGSNTITASALATDARDEIVDGVFDELLSGHTTPNTFGAITSGISSTVGLNYTDIQTLKTSVNTIDDFLDTEIAAIKAKTDNLPSDPADASDIAASFTTVNTKLDAIDDYVDTEIAAIKAKTDNLPSDPADASDIAASFSTVNTAIAALPTASAIATAVGSRQATESYASDGSVPTYDQFLFMIWAALAQFAITGTTISAKKLDGTTEAMTFTIDDESAPTSRTRAS
jgi:hypothetical protein